MAGIVDLLKRKKEQFMDFMGGVERTGHSITNRMKRLQQAGDKPGPAAGSSPAPKIPMEVTHRPPGYFDRWKPKRSMKRMTK